jgi:hypothetical protein
VVGGKVVEAPVLLGVQVNLPVGEPDGPIGIGDTRGVRDIAEVLADGLLRDFQGVVPEMRGKGGRHPVRDGGVVVGDREAEQRLELGIPRRA